MARGRDTGIALLMLLNSLLNQHTGHVAHRARLQFCKGRQPGAEILRQHHLNPWRLGFAAGRCLTRGHDRVPRGSLRYQKVYRGQQG